MLLKRFGAQLIFAVSLLLPILVLAHAAQHNRILLVTGHPGELAVVEMGGHSYVDLESLARFVDGTLSFSGNRIVLSLPSAAASPTAARPVTSQPPPASASHVMNPPGSQPAAVVFSKEFLRAAIEQMSVIREWRSTLTNAVQRGFPVTEEWTAAFQDRARKNLRLVSVAMATESDRNAFELLTNEFNNIKKLSDRFVEANKSRTYMGPDSLKNDPLDQRILACGHSLASMTAKGQFVDDGTCH